MATIQEPRSWLFVPGDSERKLSKSLASGADALILDLEDSVAQARKDAARNQVLEFLKSEAAGRTCWVRINPLTTEGAKDLIGILQGEPAGVMLPKAEGLPDLRRLSKHLDELEREYGVVLGQTGVVLIATETPRAVLKLKDFAAVEERRLRGLTWGAEDLAAAIGASDNRGEDGDWTAPFQLARNLTLLAARAAGVQPIDTLYADFKDSQGLRNACDNARRDGFTAKLAIHPGQVEIINEAFRPSEAELDWARAVVAAFNAEPGAGVVSVDGKMLDKPHLARAEAVLRRSGS